MARIRSIKPEFWTDSKMVALNPITRLFFVGSWNFADDFGVLEDDADSLKLRIMPADSFDAHAAVDELVERGRLVRRRAPNGAAVLVIAHFSEHQRIDKRAAGKWGDPAEWPESPPIPTDPSESPPIPPLEGKGKEGKGKEGKGRAAAAPPVCAVVEDGFDAWWLVYPRKVAKQTALKAWESALKRASLDELQRGLEAATAAWEREDRPMDKIPHAATWLNQDRWNDIHAEPRPQIPRQLRGGRDWLAMKEARDGLSPNGSPVDVHGERLPAADT